MQINQILQDDAEADVKVHEEIMKAYNTIVSRLTHFHKTRQNDTSGFEISVDEHDAIMLRPRNLKTENTFLGKTHLVLIDGSTFNGNRGAFMPNSSAINAPMIYLKSFSFQYDEPFKLTAPEKDVLYHELVHAYQILHRKIPYASAANHDVDTDDGTTAYYNDPLEFDARIHEIAKDLNSAISMLKNEVERGKYDLTDDVIEIIVGDIPLNSRDFIDELQKNASQYSSKGKNLWFHALPKRKKSMVKRLYKLHTYMLEYIKKHKSQ